MAKKKNRTWSDAEFDLDLKEILASTVNGLSKAVHNAKDKLTEDELARMTVFKDGNGQGNQQICVRAVKAILLAIAADEIDKMWQAESLKPKVSQVKRIIKKRP